MSGAPFVRTEEVRCLKCSRTTKATVFQTRGGGYGGFVECICNYKREGTCATVDELKAHLEAVPEWDGEFEYKEGAQFGWMVGKRWLAATIVACLPPFHSAKAVVGKDVIPFMDRSSRPRYILSCADGKRISFRSPIKTRVENILAELEGS